VALGSGQGEKEVLLVLSTSQEEREGVVVRRRM
jgi:hypothetical protein